MGKGKKLKYSGNTIVNQSNRLIVERDDAYLSRKVRFSFKDSQINGPYGAVRIFSNRDSLQALFTRLGEIENYTWSDFQNLKREQGWSAEKKTESNHKEMQKCFPAYSTFGHIRVKTKNNNFRIFCARREDLIYILQFDLKGKKNH